MTRSAKRIYAFLDEQSTEYRNAHGIEFHLSVDKSIFVIFALDLLNHMQTSDYYTPPILLTAS